MNQNAYQIPFSPPPEALRHIWLEGGARVEPGISPQRESIHLLMTGRNGSPLIVLRIHRTRGISAECYLESNQICSQWHSRAIPIIRGGNSN